jgi:deoxycytidine triphosphate deaminase/intein/homing endonuclease
VAWGAGASVPPVILSDRTIREQLAAGRIVIEPLDEDDIQPSSVDLHIDRFFRVFRNHTMGHIDVRRDLQELTELVEVAEDEVFILHPGEFVLGSTAERVALPDDLVARLEGKSSLGRLGLLIHSSLPGGEPVVVLHDGVVRTMPIEDVVRKQLQGSVVSFDPETFEVGYHPITGWYEGPPDRIYEVVLASGRRVRVTAGHNLFTLDHNGHLTKVRTAELRRGLMVAIPRHVPDPLTPAPKKPVLDLRLLAPEEDHAWLVVEGPTVAAALDDEATARLLVAAGHRHVDHFRRKRSLPMLVARQVPGLFDALGRNDRVRGRGGRNGVPVLLDVDEDLAWLLGLYVAEGYRRPGQVVLSNTDDAILDRVEAVLGGLGLPVHRRDGVAVTCSSTVLSALLGWIGAGGKAATKRLPVMALGWHRPALTALLQGLLDGDGSHGSADRRVYWSCSPGLVDDVLLLAPRLGLRAAASERQRGSSRLFQVSLTDREHKLTPVPLADALFRDLRAEIGLTQRAAGRLLGFRGASDLNNLERRSGRDAVRLETLRRLVGGYRAAGDAPSQPLLDRLIEGGLAWDRVVEVRDTGEAETIFDLEVRPGGRHVENFLAGPGGVFVSNTAGFVDAGWDGHLTLELSNVANLPITLVPGMKIGQISFLQMTTSADRPYGSGELGSKYRGQRGPTASRYFENFDR